MFKFVLITLAVFIAATAATNVKKCNKGQPFPLSVEVVGCEQPPCNVVKGTTAVMHVRFVGTKDNMNNLNAVVDAKVFGITVPYKLPENVADVCANLLDNVTCPIAKSEDVVYAFNFYVADYYPEISVDVQVSLEDENKESVACFVVPVKVK